VGGPVFVGGLGSTVNPAVIITRQSRFVWHKNGKAEMLDADWSNGRQKSMGVVSV